MTDYNDYIIRFLKEEAAQAKAEAQAVQNSLRYRAGSLLLESFPPSRRSFFALWALLQLFLEHLGRGRKTALKATVSRPAKALSADTLIWAVPDTEAELSGRGVWVTSDVAQLIAVIDAVKSPGILVLQQLDEAVVRRTARWQALGGRVQWQPVQGQQYCPVLLSYMQALVNAPMEPCV